MALRVHSQDLMVRSLVMSTQWRDSLCERPDGFGEQKRAALVKDEMKLKASIAPT